MPEIIVTAKTVDEAVAEGCNRLNLKGQEKGSYVVIQAERGFPFKRPAIVKVMTGESEKTPIYIPKSLVHIESESDNVPKCPTCQSSNVKKISDSKRMISTGILGLASSDIGKTMECKNCGYKW